MTEEKEYDVKPESYTTCDRCSYDIKDEDGDILEHYCIDDELYIPNQINK